MPESLSDNFYEYYKLGREQGRLQEGVGELERLRTQEIITRYIPKSGSVLDVGGGAGVYALWLARRGYDVYLVDIVDLHIQQALLASTKQVNAPLKSAKLGDARQLDVEDTSFDAVLLLGPLYHLTDKSERLQALGEAHRVLKDNGVVISVCITRFASFLSGLKRGLDDPNFVEIIQHDLEDGQHRNPNPMESPVYFTTAYFHHPTELAEEMVQAGFNCKATIMVEGPVWMGEKFDEIWSNPDQREVMLDMLRQIESEQSLFGASPHLIVIGEKG